MGAKDAIFALESCGIKAHLNGVGKVRRQSAAAGSDKRKGMTVELYLK
jgi:cell division protein FtsI (penicillin-binding protein 3)